MNERPRRWLAHPTPADQQALVRQFGTYGIPPGLLSPTTIRLIAWNFDRFAPIIVAAQRPPHAPHPELQVWYRDRADRAQSDSMKAALREWLVVPVREAPLHGGSRTQGPGWVVLDEILSARLEAAEALGDWRDKGALPRIRALLDSVPPPGRPSRHGRSSRHALLVAIRRITDPDHADVLVTPRGRVELHRPFTDLDSLVVHSRDDIARHEVSWRADVSAARRIWTSLLKGHENQPWSIPGIPKGERPMDSFYPRRMTLDFRDGTVAKLEARREDWWEYSDNTRLGHKSITISNPKLAAVVMDELLRAGVAPAAPRFVDESVTLTVGEGEFEVIGNYGFEGAPPDGRLTLLYPIAANPGLGEPRIEEVVLEPGSHRKPPQVAWEQHGSLCRIALQPGKVRAYGLHVRYRQPFSGRSVAYLITTAKAWGRPLHRARFYVTLPDSIGEPRFSLPMREAWRSSGQRRFIFEAAPFQPDRDLVMSW